MPNDLQYLVGVSWPRSGHHLVERILQKYFEDRFRYCEYYSLDDCCKQVPCAHRGEVNLSKNHDFDGSVPMLSGYRYLIQYRNFVDSLVSDYEVSLRGDPDDSAASFRKFARHRLRDYRRFMARWSAPPPPGATFVRLAYEDLIRTPADHLAALVRLFEPDREPDLGRLRAIAAGISRPTVERGTELLQEDVGIRSFRDVRQFRHYDRDFFARLARDAADSYRSVRALGPIQHGAPEGPDGAAAVRLHRFYVDVSSQLALHGLMPTGIPRVQDFIARRAVNDPDPRVVCIVFDAGGGGFRRVTSYEARLLGAPVDGDPQAATDGAGSVLAEAVRRVRDYPRLGKEFDRHMAARIADPRNRPLAYNLAKLAIRLYRYWRLAAERMTRGGRADFRSRRVQDGIVLFSHHFMSSRLFERFLAASSRRAIVFYDDLPLNHPEYILDERVARRVRRQLDRLFISGVTTLCISRHAAASLSGYLQRFGPNAVTAATFPMPSMLYWKASRIGRVGRLAAAEPFILYCATIEIRKNHLMLAEIWQEALDAGRPLPPLVCVGKWGWRVDRLSAFMAAHPTLAGHVRFVGALDDMKLADLYRGALFSVFPSFSEGWGLGASESLDFGLPCIVARIPALEEAVRGLMPAIDPGDKAAWAAEIRRLASDGSARDALREVIARDHRPVPEEASWESIKQTIFGQLAPAADPASPPPEPAGPVRVSDAARRG